MKKYTFNDMADRQVSLDICRQLARQVHSRMLLDREDMGNELVYLNTEKRLYAGTWRIFHIRLYRALFHDRRF